MGSLVLKPHLTESNSTLSFEGSEDTTMLRKGELTLWVPGLKPGFRNEAMNEQIFNSSFLQIGLG